MNDLRIEQLNITNVVAPDVSKPRNVGKTFKAMLSEAAAIFSAMWTATLEKYFGQAAQSYCHVMDAANISGTDWTHNDFPYEKFLASDVDETVLTWRPIRANPPQLNPEVQRKLTATLGKHSIIIPPELNKKLQTDSELRQKVLGNIEAIYKFHTQPPPFKMPGVKGYGTKLYGSVTILNASGDVEHCVVTGGGTITGPDEETLRQIESERKRKLSRKEFNAELLMQARIEYLMTREKILSGLNAL